MMARRSSGRVLPRGWGSGHSSLCRSLGYDPNFSIIGPRDGLRLLSDATQSVDIPEHIKLDDVLSLHSLSLNSNRSLEDILRSSSRLDVGDLPWIDYLLDLYVAAKMHRQAMDYDDLLSYWYLLLTRTHRVCGNSRLVRCNFCGRISGRMSASALIVDALARPHGNLTVVVDDCQSIYGFRGADIGAILNFGTRYPTHTSAASEQLSLESEIVAVANRSIAHNTDQYARPCERRGTGPASGRWGGFERVAGFVAHRIQALHDEVPYGEQAILYRTHAVESART